VTGRPGRDRGDWVSLFPGVRVSRGWMERHTPQLLTDWSAATSEELRRAIAGLIVRIASSRLGDRDLAKGPERAHQFLRGIDPRLLDDPDWMALAATMTRAEATGLDVPAILRELARTSPLPRRHAARELHWRLLDACPDAVGGGSGDAAVHSHLGHPPAPPTG
jgi:hypothetical protein